MVVAIVICINIGGGRHVVVRVVIDAGGGLCRRWCG